MSSGDLGLTLPVEGWIHTKSRKVHIRPECQAVHFHKRYLEAVTLSADDLVRLLDEGLLCAWCFRIDRDPLHGWRNRTEPVTDQTPHGW
jgi:hypothetical protein